MEGLRLDIVTPDKVVLNAEVDYVGAEGVDGQFGLLPQHAPMLSALKVGDLYYRQATRPTGSSFPAASPRSLTTR